MRHDSRIRQRARLLADPTNREAVAVLDDAGEPLHAEELAERLVTRDVGVVDAADYEREVERTAISLHHGRLPRLAEAGLIEYDRGSNLATYRDSSPPDVEWHDAPIDGLVGHLRPDTEEEIGVLTGRESALEFGRRLIDEAEEELFCMYVNTDLLEDECIRHAKNAIDRGVTLYLGSGNADVRDLARERLPEATVWEPQLDWTNTPTYPRVGRLVLADRRAVMLAVLDEPASDGTRPEETAIVGDGEENPLVVLVRDLLGPRLDHLDLQSEDFRSRLSS